MTPLKSKKPPKTKKTSRKKPKKPVSSSFKKEEEKKIIKRTYLFAVGRRKSSVARVRYYKKGEGEFIVNNKKIDEYFKNLEFQNVVSKPLTVINLKDFGKISVLVKGGGKRGQAEAISLGLARVLELLDEKNRPLLKANGLLTRDPRVKERKKYGLKRARRAPQWQKR